MAETINISQMAEIVARDVFNEFKWSQIGATNINWSCVKLSEHKKDTHPADSVFYYDEPYSGDRTYVHCDLKSYASGSITKGNLTEALISLAMQISCAEISEEWQSNFTVPPGPFNICGLLFIYNHDGGFDRSFDDLKEMIDLDQLDMPENSKIFILGPANINWLYNVSQEIKRMRGLDEEDDESPLPKRAVCSYFYPEPVRRVRQSPGTRLAATLEVLTSPWICLHYEVDEVRTKDGYVIFFQGKGEKIEEFTYLIDYLRLHEFLRPDASVRIRAIDESGQSTVNFQRARQQYIQEATGKSGDTGFAKLLNSIDFRLFSRVLPSFSQVDIGMRYDR